MLAVGVGPYGLDPTHAARNDSIGWSVFRDVASPVSKTSGHTIHSASRPACIDRVQPFPYVSCLAGRACSRPGTALVVRTREPDSGSDMRSSFAEMLVVGGLVLLALPATCLADLGVSALTDPPGLP
jgi:hypothetical protein